MKTLFGDYESETHDGRKDPAVNDISTFSEFARCLNDHLRCYGKLMSEDGKRQLELLADGYRRCRLLADMLKRRRREGLLAKCDVSQNSKDLDEEARYGRGSPAFEWSEVFWKCAFVASGQWMREITRSYDPALQSEQCTDIEIFM